MDKKPQPLKTAEVSLFDATKPLLILSRLIGLNPKTNWHKIYTVFILLCIFALLRMAWYFYSLIDVGNHGFNFVIRFLEDVCRTLLILVILVLTFIDEKRYMVPTKAFASIDQSLRSLGGYIDNKETYRFAVLQVIYVILVPFFLELLEFSSQVAWINILEYRILFILHDSYTWITTTVWVMVDCTFVMSLSIIRKRFKKINSIIRRIGNRELSLRIKFLQIASERTENDVLKTLKILRKQYHDLWLIVNQLNKAYGPYLLMEMVTSLCLLTGELWRTYFGIKYHEGRLYAVIIGSTAWAGYHILKILCLTKACESTVATGKTTTANLLQELGMNENESPATKSEVRDFLTQLQLEAQNFNACKCFDVNLKLVCGMTGVICTYLVILVQLNESSVCESAVVANKSTN